MKSDEEIWNEIVEASSESGSTDLAAVWRAQLEVLLDIRQLLTPPEFVISVSASDTMYTGGSNMGARRLDKHAMGK